MGTLLSLVTETSVGSQTLIPFPHVVLAEAAAEGGFGFHFNLFESNIINLSLLIFILFYFGRKVVGNLLSERRSGIETAVREVEQRLRKAAEALAEEQQKLAQAQVQAEQIRADAQKNAKAAGSAILAKAAQDVERLKAEAARDLDIEQERAIADLRRRAVALALQQAESQLSDRLDDAAQQQLVNRSIAMLGG